MLEKGPSTKTSKVLVALSMALPCLGFFFYCRWLLHWNTHLGIFDYYQSIYDNTSSGRLPWIHYDLEYPPLSVPLIFGPVLLVKGLSVLKVTLFRGLWSLFVTLYVQYRMGFYELKFRKIPIATLLVGVCLLIANKLYFSVYDWIPMCLILLAFVLRAERSKSVALLLVGLFSKIVPGFIYLWLPGGRPGEPWYKRHALLLALVAFHIAYAVFHLPGAINAITYHTLRTIDAYGIYGVIAMTLGHFGISPEKVATLNSTESVVGPVSAIFKSLSMPLVVVLVGAAHLPLRRTQTEAAPEARLNFGWLMGILTVLAFTLFGKLGQTNYCFWIVACTAVMLLHPACTKKNQSVLIVSCILFSLLAVAQGKTADTLLHPVVPIAVLLIGFAKFLVGLPLISVCRTMLGSAARIEPA